MADYSIVKIMCPIDTYDRIHLEIQSAIDYVENAFDASEKGTSQHRDLINALEHLRIAKTMAQEGDDYTMRILEDVPQPELGLGADSTEDEEEDEEGEE